MNIFYLDNDPMVCAQMHNDKHCIKMILEYAQLLSTAHRVLDGVITQGTSPSGRKRTTYRLADHREAMLYSATHINHPSAVWVRQSYNNYMWLSELLIELCKEYTYRYGKVHKVERDGLLSQLLHSPKNINLSKSFTEPTPAMPEDVKVLGNSIESYRNYYIKNKTKLASWKGKVNSRPIPQWYGV
jgi:cyclophilin family peptidyl-prolyl cis-trans isomerase